MRFVSLLLVAGCAKSSTPPPELPSNTAGDEPAPAGGPVTNERLPLGPPGSCAVGGTILDTKTSEALAGATIVLSGGSMGEQAAVSDNDGHFLVHSPNVPERVDFYYLDLHHPLQYSAATCGRALRIAFDTAAK